MASISRLEFDRCPENAWQQHGSCGWAAGQDARGAGPAPCAVRAPLAGLFCSAPALTDPPDVDTGVFCGGWAPTVTEAALPDLPVLRDTGTDAARPNGGPRWGVSFPGRPPARAAGRKAQPLSVGAGGLQVHLHSGPQSPVRPGTEQRAFPGGQAATETPK